MSQSRWIVCGAFVMLFATLGNSPVAGGAGRADAAAVAAPRAEAQASGAAIAWRACGNRLQCARVRVPLDWSRATVRAGRVVSAGPTISLAVIRYRTRDRRRRIGSLFMNFGGPGVAGTPNVRAAGAAFDGLAGGRFDIVGWDPRGTGASTHVRCFADRRSMLRFWGADWSIPTTPLESRRYVPKTVDYARRCEARSGRLLAHISTADTVRDLDYLRSLVGDRRLNYRGESYGTFLGQTYANMFPRRVGRMVLDALIDPVPFTRSVEAGIASNSADAGLVFKKFLSLCQQAGPARCALAGQGPVAPRARALLARLRRGPIPAPSAASRQLSYGDTLLALWLSLGAPENWPKLAAELNQAAGGDGSALANTVGEPQTRRAGGLGLGHGAAMRGQAAPAAWRDQAVADGHRPVPRTRRGRRRLVAVGAVRVVAHRQRQPLHRPMERHHAQPGPRHRQPLRPQNGVRQRPACRPPAGNAVLLTNNGYGHTSSSDISDCTIRATTRYLTTLATPRNGTVCQPNHRPFDPDFGQ